MKHYVDGALAALILMLVGIVAILAFGAYTFYSNPEHPGMLCQWFRVNCS